MDWLTQLRRRWTLSDTRWSQLQAQLDRMSILHGSTLAELHRSKVATDLCDYEFGVFSQWGEDGIIQHLVSTLAIEHHTFIEFGVADFFESNCRFLLEKDRWQGFAIDGSDDNVRIIRESPRYWRYPLEARAAFVTRENVNRLLSESGLGPNPGILSVDVDGNDYHILDALPDWRPSILITEYNALFGCDRAVSVPYDPAFVRHDKHYSGLYAGASLPAFVHLAGGRGYALVGVNSAGNNAFFVRRDLLNDRVAEVAAKDVFRDATFRESRGPDGALTFLTGHSRRDVIANLPLLDVTSGEPLRVGDLP